MTYKQTKVPHSTKSSATNMVTDNDTYGIAANFQNQKLGLLKRKIRNIRPKIGTKIYS